MRLMQPFFFCLILAAAEEADFRGCLGGRNGLLLALLPQLLDEVVELILLVLELLFLLLGLLLKLDSVFQPLPTLLLPPGWSRSSPNATSKQNPTLKAESLSPCYKMAVETKVCSGQT